MDDGHGAQAEHRPPSSHGIGRIPFGALDELDFNVGNFLEFHQMVCLVDGVLIGVFTRIKKRFSCASHEVSWASTRCRIFLF